MWIHAIKIPESRGPYAQLVGVCLALASLCTGGCYDGQAIIEARRAIAVRARLVEVDLGKFRVTLPKPYRDMEKAELHFHAFGQVAHRDLDKVEESLKQNSANLNHHILLAVRNLNTTQIAEPNLATLRQEIIQAINGIVEGAPVQSIGFYQFALTN